MSISIYKPESSELASDKIGGVAPPRTEFGGYKAEFRDHETEFGGREIEFGIDDRVASAL